MQILLLPRRGVFIKVKKSPSGKEENDNSNKHNNKNPGKKFRYAREIKLRNNNKKRREKNPVKTENLDVPFRLKYTAHSGRIEKKKGVCLRKK